MQAGVPIVPIVIRNAGELMWRGASTIREGTVEVTVLPPVPTEGWTVEELPKHVDEVRERYLETLAEWDGPPAPVHVTTGPTGPVAAPLEWGTAAEMNPLETAMWRGELADPRLRSNVTLLELLDVTPGWDRLLAAHEWASRMVPRMRQRVVEPALGVGAPAWVTVDRLDMTSTCRAPTSSAARCASCSTWCRSSRGGRSTATGRCGGRCSSRGCRTGERRTWWSPTTPPPTASVRSSSWRACTAVPRARPAATGARGVGGGHGEPGRHARGPGGARGPRGADRCRAAADPAHGGPRTGRAVACCRSDRRSDPRRPGRRCWPPAAASGTSTCSTWGWPS
jgi:hypothetical protein